MRPAPLLLTLLALSVLAGTSMASPRGHCAPATITPIPDDPGAYRIETARGVTIARRAAPPAAPSATAITVEIGVFPTTFDVDGDTLGTVHDTILVNPGTVVRWVRRGPGFHTITNGADSGDPNAAAEYNAIFDYPTQSYERAFTTLGTHNYFCFIHEPVMSGTLIVTSATANVGPPGVLRHPTFSRPPAPNPARGEIRFAVAIPRATPSRVTVHDVAGRTVATLQDGALPAGEHEFRWDGRAAGGRAVQSGRYFVRLSAGDVRESRPVTVVR